MLIKNYFNISFLNFLSLLIASIIPFLVLGPFIPDLIISLTSFWFLFYSIKKKFINIILIYTFIYLLFFGYFVLFHLYFQIMLFSV